MKRTKGPKPVNLDREQLDALKQRVSDKKITEDDWELFSRLIEFCLWLQLSLAEAKLSIRRLRRLFGFKSERRGKGKKDDDPAAAPPATDDSASGDSEAQPSASEPSLPANDDTPPTSNSALEGQHIPKSSKTPKWDPNANHGRYGAADYAGCTTIEIKHAELQAGDSCPSCSAYGDHGQLYRPKEQVAGCVVLTGQSLIVGTRYEIERLRCSFCNTYYTAELPPEVKERGRYDESCAATLAIHRYYFGVPFKRIEKLQAMRGVPVPDATQWDKVSEAWEKINPVYATLVLLAAEGQPYYDDTKNKITCSIPLPDGRKGIYTTAIVSRLKAHDIFLFKTSHCTAGENIGSVFSQRERDDPILSMSDAARNNFPKHAEEKLLANWIFCFCLVHGRRKFFELMKGGDKRCEFVVEVIDDVYRHERHCRDAQLSPKERLAYHQQHSGPLMHGLWTWLQNTVQYTALETNTELGDAIFYMLNNWKELTQFLRYPGAPLDNNLCERAIKVVIRHRRNSLFFRTFFGAEVGDGFMSLIHTALMAGIDAFDYLEALQRHHQDVAVSPERWLPWYYKATLDEFTLQQAA